MVNLREPDKMYIRLGNTIYLHGGAKKKKKHTCTKKIERDATTQLILAHLFVSSNHMFCDV